MSRGMVAVLAVVSSVWMVGWAGAAPVVPEVARRALAVADTSSESARGSIALIPLEDRDRTLVAIAATFDVTKYCGATSVIVTAHVNGVAIEPPFPAFVENRGGHGCVATGVFRVDLDAAELVHPGLFIGQPLNVTLTYWG